MVVVLPISFFVSLQELAKYSVEIIGAANISLTDVTATAIATDTQD